MLVILFIAMMIYLSISRVPLVDKVYIQPKDIKEAVEKYHYVSKSLFETEGSIEVELSSDDLQSILKAASHLVPRLNVESEVSNYGAVVFGTFDVSYVFDSMYINFSCLFIPNQNSSLDSCKVGRITLPGSLVEFIANFAINTVFDESVSDVFEQSIRSFEIKRDTVYISAVKEDSLKNDIKSGLSRLSSFVKSFRVDYSNALDSEVINSYLRYIKHAESLNTRKELSLSDVFNVAFQHAKERSTQSNAMKENEYALVSVAIAFANQRFAEVYGVNTVSVEESLASLPRHTISLNGRNDLALHFLYSAIIERVGNEALSNKIGELKELFDANKGGSGFDVSDLAADIAGAKFSKFISSSQENAIHSQDLLTTSDFEDTFFPNVNRYSRSIKWDDFEKYIGTTQSEQYSATIDQLQQEVLTLALYQPRRAEVEGAPLTLGVVDAIPWVSEGTWLSVDTHIHTKHSDGGFTITAIAEKALEFGCDAIAITDHADGNLTAGTLSYFREIEAIDRIYPELSIISGLEWNLPPYEGREHATILFPQEESSAVLASQFREQFDDYKNASSPFVSVLDGLKWLETSFKPYPVLPAVFYNHPSRKASNLREIRRNAIDWQKNHVFLGFSGAPGHQRMPAERIGAYKTKLKTVDRWDPIVAEVGGVWDTLLGKGVALWGARAPSDFHGPNGDYWPCQFSETKVYARDNSINSIIEALHKGAFFGSHGKVVRDIEFTVNNHFLSRPAVMGETITTLKGTDLEISIEISLNGINWKGAPASLDEVELIVISGDGVMSKIYNAKDHTNEPVVTIVVSDIKASGDMAIRWRGRSIQKGNRDYMFYTNPIFIKAMEHKF
ncbi:PHP domain-containing protein [Vibrio japonicus]|uniref:PHP domain-containing protein n=1 Tax=Vibrio japonicus TaxID=1824638 RepID=A0ABY5LJL8_9VIBR|nr:PHP domain-containing protein [Vibrio japonicus]UUM32274.1 PHP domain-containing protein [Vibrio japonicus]